MNALAQWVGRRALVVDDSRSTRQEMSRMLYGLGFARVIEAEEGRSALAVLDEDKSIDFLLTDLNMPVMDGVELLTEVEKRYARKMFVAVMSSVDAGLLSTVREIAENSEFVLVAILPKPVSTESLAQALGRIDPNRHGSFAPRHQQHTFGAEDFRQALASGQIVSYYQPKIEVATRRVCGMEALARWLHPDLGVVPPMAFIDFIEAGEMAHPHFFHQVGQAMEMLRQTDSIVFGLSVNINLPVALLVVPNLVDDLLAQVLRKGINPDRVVLEVTETSVMSNLKACLSTLTRMRLKGFRIAMDDYGTGYSSMQQLAKCPFTELKIDRSFVHDASRNRKLLSIMTAALGICQQLNLTSVAEGVEDEGDWNQVVALGCNLAQGYHISRPLPPKELIHFLNRSALASIDSVSQ